MNSIFFILFTLLALNCAAPSAYEELRANQAAQSAQNAERAQAVRDVHSALKVQKLQSDASMVKHSFRI